MKAPEKIYVSIHSGIHHYEQKNDDDIEYTRTDAFIKKACEWLDKNLIEYWEQTNEVPDIFIEDFRNYLKGK